MLSQGTYIGQLLALSKALIPNVGGVVASHVIEVKPLQYKNASLPILVTLSGMVMLVKLVQNPNA